MHENSLAGCRYVGAAEIAHILQSIGEKVTDDEVDEMILMADLDGACRRQSIPTRGVTQNHCAPRRRERMRCALRTCAGLHCAAPPLPTRDAAQAMVRSASTSLGGS